MVNVVAEAYVHVSFAATHQSCRSAVVAIFTPSMATTQADTLVKVVSLACHNSILPTQIAVLVEGTNQAIGNPVALVSVPDAGVPSAHPETNIFAHSIAKTHADTLVIVLSDACPSSIDPTQIAVDVEATNQAIGNPVAFVSVQDDGVPRAPSNVTNAPADPTLIASAVPTQVPGVIPAQVVKSASYACTFVPITNPSVVLTCEGVLLAQALATDTKKLSVVAVNPAIVVKSESSGW